MKIVMKKFFLVLAIFSLILSTNTAVAQDDGDNSEKKEEVAKPKEGETAKDVEKTKEVEAAKEGEKSKSGTEQIKEKFIEGGGFMFPVLLALILGLAIAIEKIISVNLKSINSNKFLKKIESRFDSGDVDGAKELARNTRGPIASISYQAIERRKEGIDAVEKSIISYGSVQMGLLDKGMSWIQLFITLAPMLGFMGTVIGMIEAFDTIESQGDISAGAVAGGIKIALLTTVAGLIVAVILQLFYNYIVAKIDDIVNKMEDASISLVDMMISHKVFEK